MRFGLIGKYANIIIDIAHEKLDKTFQYKIPENLMGKISPGSQVEIPFGTGNRVIRGYVMEITDRAVFDVNKMKFILNISADSSLVEGKMLALAAWMREQYGSTMAAALRVVLPVKKQVAKKEKFKLVLTAEREFCLQKAEIYRKKHQVARLRLLSALMEEGEIPREVVIEKLNISSTVIKSLCEQGVCELTAQRQYRNPVIENEVMGKEKILRPGQQHIVDHILKDFQEEIHKTYLIQGITGSGKTEVYMEVIDGVIKSGKQAIVLIPEIALTYQTVMRFYRRFGERVSTLHSRLSEGERYDQFERAKNGEIDVMIGPRSALFTPFQRLGIIVIDEEQEASYKSEQIPKYHARETAIERARLSGASVILGSATPSIDASFRARNGTYQFFRLNERATGAKLPEVYVVDLREELAHGNRTMFSDLLRDKISDRLQKKEQIMLFLNRRGFAGFVSCRKCGHVFKCPHCDISLSSHHNGKLVCHYCGYEEKMVNRCPECGSPFIGTMRAGTEQVEQLLKKELPTATILRMDMDTTKTKEGHEKILSAFANQEADILVGTQMIVKGHDFPNVTLVGILAADLSLYANDYRAGERTFQLLTQAAGRAGRGDKSGEVVIQTYTPDNASIQCAKTQDYDTFYEQEISYRTLMGYPPVAHLLAILIESENEKMAVAFSERLARLINQCKEETVKMIGPSQATVRKIKDYYRQIIYLKSEQYQGLTEIKDQIENSVQEWENEGNEKLPRIQFDFDPMSSY